MPHGSTSPYLDSGAGGCRHNSHEDILAWRRVALGPRVYELAGEGGDFELGAGAGIEPVAPGVAQGLKESTAVMTALRKNKKQIPRSARDDNIAIRGGGASNRWPRASLSMGVPTGDGRGTLSK